MMCPLALITIMLWLGLLPLPAGAVYSAKPEPDESSLVVDLHWQWYLNALDVLLDGRVAQLRPQLSAFYTHRHLDRCLHLSGADLSAKAGCIANALEHRLSRRQQFSSELAALSARYRRLLGLDPRRRRKRSAPGAFDFFNVGSGSGGKNATGSLSEDNFRSAMKIRQKLRRWQYLATNPLKRDPITTTTTASPDIRQQVDGFPLHEFARFGQAAGELGRPTSGAGRLHSWVDGSGTQHHTLITVNRNGPPPPPPSTTTTTVPPVIDWASATRTDWLSRRQQRLMSRIQANKPLAQRTRLRAMSGIEMFNNAGRVTTPAPVTTTNGRAWTMSRNVLAPILIEDSSGEQDEGDFWGQPTTTTTTTSATETRSFTKKNSPPPHWVYLPSRARWQATGNDDDGGGSGSEEPDRRTTTTASSIIFHSFNNNNNNSSNNNNNSTARRFRGDRQQLLAQSKVLRSRLVRLPGVLPAWAASTTTARPTTMTTAGSRTTSALLADGAFRGDRHDLLNLSTAMRRRSSERQAAAPVVRKRSEELRLAPRPALQPLTTVHMQTTDADDALNYRLKHPRQLNFTSGGRARWRDRPTFSASLDNWRGRAYALAPAANNVVPGMLGYLLNIAEQGTRAAVKQQWTPKFTRFNDFAQLMHMRREKVLYDDVVELEEYISHNPTVLKGWIGLMSPSSASGSTAASKTSSSSQSSVSSSFLGGSRHQLGTFSAVGRIQRQSVELWRRLNATSDAEQSRLLCQQHYAALNPRQRALLSRSSFSIWPPLPAETDDELDSIIRWLAYGHRSQSRVPPALTRLLAGPDRHAPTVLGHWLIDSDYIYAHYRTDLHVGEQPQLRQRPIKIGTRRTAYLSAGSKMRSALTGRSAFLVDTRLRRPCALRFDDDDDRRHRWQPRTTANQCQVSPFVIKSGLIGQVD